MTSLRLSPEFAHQAAPVAALTLVLSALILGGSASQAPLARGSVEVIALLLLAILLWSPSLQAGPPQDGRLLLLCAAAFTAIGVLQLIPLPALVWSALPGRQEIAEGFRALAAPAPWLPLSLDPEATRDGLFAIAAPLAAFLLGQRLILRRHGMPIAWTIGVLAAASFLLGLVQMEAGPQSPLYVYPEQNRGWPTGLFANVNHQATLLLMATPFLAALFGNLRFRSAVIQTEHGKLALACALSAMVAAGIVLCGSIAGYVMVGPVILLGVLLAAGHLVRAGRSLLFWFAVVALALAGIGAASLPIVAAWSPDSLWGAGAAARPEVFAQTAKGALAHFPFGVGLGAFPAMYPFFENPDQVTPAFPPHAHNDYLELAFELGVLGLGVCAIAIGWWLQQSIKVWRMAPNAATRVRRAASIAIGVVLVHSIVDYPVRTLAIATLAGLCAGIMIAPAEQNKPDQAMNGQQRKQRSVEL
jgi:O-antigen ligase